MPNAEICPQDLGGTERQLRNGDLMMTYYIMFAGFATAIVVFSTEIIFRYINGRHETPHQWAGHGVGRTPNGHQFKPVNWFWRKSSTDSTHILLNNSKYNNITPPPPYRSIFSSKNSQNEASVKKWHQALHGGFGVLKPAIADAQYGGMGITSTGLRKFINGREYMVYRTPDGQNQLVPVRVPSAALFQYTYTD